MPTRLGQNFLKNKEIVKKIIQSANLTSDDLVLEIGPGKGILTEELTKYAGKVVAVEIDKDLVARLDSRLHGNDKIKIINDDILKIDIKELLSSYFPSPPAPLPKGEGGYSFKLIANLPYYITSPIIRKFLEAEFPPSEIILMIQKEVAERIVAEPGKMSILSVSVQYYAQPEILFYVGKENFDPAPEVDSAVIEIVPHPAFGHPLPKGEGDFNKKFFRIVRAGFSAKRKTLVNNLANGFHFDKSEIEKKLAEIGIKKSSRAQELSVKDWKKLTELFQRKTIFTKIRP